MKIKNNEKTITFRLTGDLYQKCINKTLNKSIKENRVIKLSEIIREAIEKGI